MMPSKWKYLARRGGKEIWLTRYRLVSLSRYCIMLYYVEDKNVYANNSLVDVLFSN
jgi:hypothetical protein